MVPSRDALLAPFSYAMAISPFDVNTSTLAPTGRHADPTFSTPASTKTTWYPMRKTSSLTCQPALVAACAEEDGVAGAARWHSLFARIACFWRGNECVSTSRMVPTLPGTTLDASFLSGCAGAGGGLCSATLGTCLALPTGLTATAPSKARTMAAETTRGSQSEIPLGAQPGGVVEGVAMARS